MSNAGFDEILKLVNEARLRKSSARGVLIESESDKGRVINSAAFRRLQQKAQVFPLEPNAAVRSRLTHSIEVSQIGRHLVQKIIGNYKSNSGDYDKLAAFVNTVETACLLHDIGNPPFGHFGESAAQEWFGNNASTIKDLTEFDGNPQGFRLMSFLSGADNFGFNLTCTLLLSTVKYPWGLANNTSRKKYGLFEADLDNYERACNSVGWPAGKRFPFARLMDTADDIAYSLSDLEDGLEKKIISLDDLKGEFGAERFTEGSIKPIVKFRTTVINQAVDTAAEAFKTKLDGILAGEDFPLIEESLEISELLKKVNTFARRRIYADESAEQVELAGYSVIKGLLSHFGRLLQLPEDDFLLLVNDNRNAIRKKNLDFHIRLFRRLPEAYREKYCAGLRGNEAQRRAHLIVDFVSGMTDDFALDTYQVLEGIKIK